MMLFIGYQFPASVKAADDCGVFSDALALYRRVQPSPLPELSSKTRIGLTEHVNEFEWLFTYNVVDVTSYRLQMHWTCAFPMVKRLPSAKESCLSLQISCLSDSFPTQEELSIAPPRVDSSKGPAWAPRGPTWAPRGPHVGPPTWAPRGPKWGNMGAKYFQEFGPIFLWVKNIFRNLPPFFMGEEYFQECASIFSWVKHIFRNLPPFFHG